MTAPAAGRRRVEISNPDKVLFPDDGITKAELVDYYSVIGPTMLPHVRGRPLMMERYPNGIAGHRVVQKEVPSHFPEWIARVAIPKKGGTVTQVVPGDVATLVYLANQACITPHPWLSRADMIDHPDQLVIDLDPSTTDFTPVRAGAWALRSLFIELGLTPFVKTTGSRGLHVVVPLDRSADFETARAFARGVAEVLCESDPDVFTLEWRKDNRRGRVFVDLGRNAYAQTAVAPYALRPLPHAPVAAPVRWEELDDAGFGPRLHTLRSVPARVADAGDPWAGMGRRARSLREPIRRLERMRTRARG